MSGHSKWSKVKHQKKGTDAAKSAAFTKASRALTIAAKEGGAKLRFALEQARALNMPKETIERAIARGSAEEESLETVVYEGYGPGGIAFLIEAATDNRQRTASLVKNILERSGGTLTSPGGVGYLFERQEGGTVPKITIPVEKDMHGRVTSLVESLSALEDVQRVFTNVAQRI